MSCCCKSLTKQWANISIMLALLKISVNNYFSHLAHFIHVDWKLSHERPLSELQALYTVAGLCWLYITFHNAFHIESIIKRGIHLQSMKTAITPIVVLLQMFSHPDQNTTMNTINNNNEYILWSYNTYIKHTYIYIEYFEKQNKKMRHIVDIALIFHLRLFIFLCSKVEYYIFWVRYHVRLFYWSGPHEFKVGCMWPFN